MDNEKNWNKEIRKTRANRRIIILVEKSYNGNTEVCKTLNESSNLFFSCFLKNS